MSKIKMEIIDAEINLEWNYDTFNTECPICTNSLYEPSVESKNVMLVLIVVNMAIILNVSING